jgi:hypothetical protein
MLQQTQFKLATRCGDDNDLPARDAKARAGGEKSVGQPLNGFSSGDYPECPGRSMVEGKSNIEHPILNGDRQDACATLEAG